MKTLIVTPYFYPAVGGVENYVLSIARGLKNDYGHQVVIVTSTDKISKVKKKKFEGMTVYYLPFQFKLSNTPISFKWKSQLKEIFLQEKPDVVNAHTPVPFLADVAARACDNIPFILTYHNDLVKSSLIGSLLAKTFYILLGRKTMERSDQIIATSEYYVISSPYLQKFKNKVSIVSPGVDLDRFTTANSEWLKKKYPDKKIVLFTGSMKKTHMHKGVDVLIKSIATVKKSIPNIQLLAAGKGDAIPVYKKLADELGITSNVDFLGFVSDEDLPKYYSGADLFILPSTNRAEGFGMVLTEAQASGTPVIGTNVGGIPFAMKDKKTGYIVEPGNSSALGSAIKKILNSNSSTFSKNAVKFVSENFDWKTQIQTTDGILSSSINRPIIHVVATYPPHLGGMENVVRTLATTQDQSGIEVSVITSNIGSSENASQETFPISRLGGVEIAHTPILPSLLPKLLCINKRKIVHLHIAQAYTPEMVWLASKIKRFRYVAHVHLDVPPSGPAGFLLKVYKPLILKHVLRSAAFVVVFTEDQKKLMHKKYGIALPKIQVIPNGVEDKFYYSKLRKLHPKPKLLFVGRLCAQKNVKQLLSSLDGISDQFNTTIIGDGEMQAELKHLARELGLKNVSFAGRVVGDKLLRFYKNADLFVLTSEREGMPLVLLEAMAMGLPVIGTDVVGIREVIKDQKNGRLVPYGDHHSLRDTLLAIKANPMLYEVLSKNTHSSATQYKFSNVLEKFQYLYREIYP